jgi:hypothetical protein
MRSWHTCAMLKSVWANVDQHCIDCANTSPAEQTRPCTKRGSKRAKMGPRQFACQHRRVLGRFERSMPPNHSHPRWLTYKRGVKNTKQHTMSLKNSPKPQQPNLHNHSSHKPSPNYTLDAMKRRMLLCSKRSN